LLAYVYDTRLIYSCKSFPLRPTRYSQGTSVTDDNDGQTDRRTDDNRTNSLTVT